MWEVLYFNFMPHFMDSYFAAQIHKVQTAGLDAATTAARVVWPSQHSQQLYQNPLINMAYTLMEPLPVGVLITVTSAASPSPHSPSAQQYHTLLGLRAQLRPRLTLNSSYFQTRLTMARVTGIGGVFLRSKDPKRLSAWYAAHLGLPVTEWGVSFDWKDEVPAGTGARPLWSTFAEDSDFTSATTRGKR